MSLLLETLTHAEESRRKVKQRKKISRVSQDGSARVDSSADLVVATNPPLEPSIPAEDLSTPPTATQLSERQTFNLTFDDESNGNREDNKTAAIEPSLVTDRGASEVQLSFDDGEESSHQLKSKKKEISPEAETGSLANQLSFESSEEVSPSLATMKVESGVDDTENFAKLGTDLELDGSALTFTPIIEDDFQKPQAKSVSEDKNIETITWEQDGSLEDYAPHLQSAENSSSIAILGEEDALIEEIEELVAADNKRSTREGGSAVTFTDELDDHEDANKVVNQTGDRQKKARDAYKSNNKEGLVQSEVKFEETDDESAIAESATSSEGVSDLEEVKKQSRTRARKERFKKKGLLQRRRKERRKPRKNVLIGGLLFLLSVVGVGGYFLNQELVSMEGSTIATNNLNKSGVKPVIPQIGKVVKKTESATNMLPAEPPKRTEKVLAEARSDKTIKPASPVKDQEDDAAKDNGRTAVKSKTSGNEGVDEVEPDAKEPNSVTSAQAKEQTVTSKELNSKQAVEKTALFRQTSADGVPGPAPTSVSRLPGSRFGGGVGDSKKIYISRQSDVEKLAKELNIASNAFQNGDLNRAKQSFNTVLNADPENHRAMIGLASVALRHGDRLTAKKYYQQVLKEDSKNSIALTGLAGIDGISGSVDDESRIKSLLNESPNASHLHFALGNIYARQQRWPKAFGSYSQAYNLNMGNPEIILNLAVSLDHLRRYSDALEYYKKAVRTAKIYNIVNFNQRSVNSRIAALQEKVK